MPTVPTRGDAPHRAREAAESFGTDAERYDRTRPRYPQALVDAILARIGGPEVLDVGIGTGVSADPFRAAGGSVLGVEPDPRMAQFARLRGFEVEIASFEDWDPARRTFDTVISGTTWHWVDPLAGAAKAAAVLRPGGQIALFWNVARPPAELARAFSGVYQRVLPCTPFATPATDPLNSYTPILTSTETGLREAGGFTEPERRQFDWARDYTREQWLDQVPTFGGHSTLPPAKLGEVLPASRPRSTRPAAPSRCAMPPWPSPPAGDAARSEQLTHTGRRARASLGGHQACSARRLMGRVGARHSTGVLTGEPGSGRRPGPCHRTAAAHPDDRQLRLVAIAFVGRQTGG